MFYNAQKINVHWIVIILRCPNSICWFCGRGLAWNLGLTPLFYSIKVNSNSVNLQLKNTNTNKLLTPAVLITIYKG